MSKFFRKNPFTFFKRNFTKVNCVYFFLIEFRKSKSSNTATKNTAGSPSYFEAPNGIQYILFYYSLKISISAKAFLRFIASPGICSAIPNPTNFVSFAQSLNIRTTYLSVISPTAARKSAASSPGSAGRMALKSLGERTSKSR